MWIPDHFVFRWQPSSPWLECWSMLAALAARTHRIRLGSLVTHTVYRNPAILARTAMTVDQISGRRLERSEFAAPANALIERYVPHAAVLPHAAAMVTQCGIGTLSKALAHGVPLVCIPILGDQHDNAARVITRRAGVRLNSRASPRAIRCALERVLRDQTFRINAARLATRCGVIVA